MRRNYIHALPGVTSPRDIPRVLDEIVMFTTQLRESHIKAYNDLGAGSMPETLKMWQLWNNATTNTTQ